MTCEQHTLIQLVRHGISDVEGGFVCYENVDWNILINLAFDQGIAAITVDGLQKIYDTNPYLELEIDKEELEGVKYEWFGESVRAEEEYSRHESVLSDLVDTLSEQNIKILLLKGLGLSKYYPIPNHRQTGDFDIFSYGRHLDVDSLFRKNGINIDCSYPKHSVFNYERVTVENHYIYLDSFITKCETKVQSFIESLEDDVLTENGYYTPSPLKNYFFLLCHTARHFSEIGGITLRHIIDWGLFLKNERDKLDLSFIRNKLQEFGLQKTNDLFVSLAESVCGCDFSSLIFERLHEDECSKVLDYIMSEKEIECHKNIFLRILYKFRTIVNSQWKYQYLAITMRERVWYSMKSYVEKSWKR